MSTETALSEALSPAEQAYFTSKGSDLSGFKPEGTPETQGTPSEGLAQPEATEAAPEGDGVPDPNAEDDGEGIYIDADGKPRSVITGKFVPHAALHKERSKRKAVEAENMTMREKMARAEERLAVLNEVIMQADKPETEKAKAQEPETPPDPEQDIFAYVKWQKAELERMKAQNESERHVTEQRRVSEQVQTIYRQDAMRYMQEKPDFSDAYTHLAKSYAQELKALGHDDNAIKNQMAQAEGQIVVEALRRQLSPAQVIYQQAIARGYAPKQAQAQSQQMTSQQKLEAVQKGQKAHASLSSAGGSSGEGLTYETLANMSEEEFFAVSQKLGKSKMRSLLGG